MGFNPIHRRVGLRILRAKKNFNLFGDRESTTSKLRQTRRTQAQELRHIQHRVYSVPLVNMGGETDPILEYERHISGVNVDSLTHLLDGSDATSRRRRYLTSVVESDPTFSNKDNADMSRLERMESALKKAAKLHVLCQRGEVLHGIGPEVNKNIQGVWN